MPHSSDHHWDRLFNAIGKVVCQWARLETDLAELLFEVSAASSPAFKSDAAASLTFMIITENMDLRAIAAAIKALNIHLEWDTEFQHSIVPTLNVIENDLRNERNRYVHDEWRLNASGKARRLKRGTRILREQGSGAESAEIGSETTYEDIGQVEALARRIEAARDAVKAYQAEVTAIQFPTLAAK